VAVSLADKLDSLIHFFAVGERPSGSRDPFALRRAALGVISTIITNDIRLSLNKFFQIVLPEIGYMQGWQQAGKEFAALEAALEASLLSDEQKLKFIMDNPFNVQLLGGKGANLAEMAESRPAGAARASPSPPKSAPLSFGDAPIRCWSRCAPARAPRCRA
jgi:hypothetical protein